MKPGILYFLLLLFVCTIASAQEMRLVSGIIRDKDKEPIIGVSVSEKGTTNGTITNFDGYYEIHAPLGSTLLFTYVGMESSEMKVSVQNSKPSTRKPHISGENQTEKKENLDRSKSPYFLIKSDSSDPAKMPLQQTDVAVQIAGVIADVCVTQTYINQSKNTLEAVYVFPASTRAAVYGMTMTIGERRIEARIKEKEKARKEYEQAKEEGKSTTLLEQHRPNVFQMNVGNILPGDTILVEMRYTELLENPEGIYEFVYPTVVGPRYSQTGEEWVEHSINQHKDGKTPQFSIRTIIQAGMPIQKISSTSHSLSIESPEPGQAIISLSNPKDFEGNRDYILHYQLQEKKVQSGILRYEHEDENFFLLMVQPPKTPTIEQIPPREYVFIIDVSGSMYGLPLEISKKLIRNLISSLRPTDRFNVMLFESSNAMLYPTSVAATAENIEKAITLIDQQRGNGGTELYPAIVNAMNFKETEGYSRTFIILTDGFVTVEKEAFNYVRSHLNQANLFPFGIGNSVNRYIIEGLAHAGMGTPYIITNFSEAEAIGEKAIQEISQPVLTNISVDWGDLDVYDVEPVGIPDVFAQRPILIYGKYKGNPRGTITVSGLAGDTHYQQKFNIAKARREHNQALRYLWARNQIRYYDDYAQYYEGEVNGWYDNYGNHKRSDKQIKRVTELGLKYNLLTQYTSFLAVDEVVRTQPSQKEFMPTTKQVSAPDFTLDSSKAELSEVVVVGYGSRRKSDITASVSSVSGEAITSSSSAHLLQGRVAGVQIDQTSGEPGDPARIRIRGNSSLIDNNTPLVVMDGVPVEYSTLSQMNPNDIESITILKDASASAIYGSRASNGVIIITSSQKTSYKSRSISWHSSFAVEMPNKLPKLQRQFAQGRPENGAPVWNTTNEAFSWGPDIQTIGADTYDPYDIFKTGYTLKNHLTFAEKYGKYNYLFRLGNNTQQGFIPGSKFNENSMSLRFSRDNTRKFSFDIDLNYKNTQGKRLQRGYNRSGIMQGILLTPPTFNNQPSTLEDGSQRTAGAAVDNPYWLLNNNPFSDEANRFNGYLNLNYKVTDFLSLNYLLSGDYLLNEAKTALNSGSVYIPGGHIMNREERFRALQSKFLVKFYKSWNNFEANATLGHEYNLSKRTIDRQDGYELTHPGNYQLYHAGRIETYRQALSRHSNAVFGKAGANYRQMFAMEAALRKEWSSINHANLFSPSAGLAVYLNELFYYEPFSLIKLYANIARADKETPLYIDPVYFNSATYNLNDASQHFESREVVWENLKPETIRHYELGANIGLWNNRINLSASWYWKRGKDQLLPTQISASSISLENCGAFRTHGFEAELNARLINTRHFYWKTQLIFSRERNRVTNLGGRKLMLAGIEGVAGSYAIEGQPLGVLYGTVYQRDTQGGLIMDSDGFPTKSEELKILGNSNPDWQLSWSNSLMYKNFTLSLLLDYRKGGKMWNGTQNTMNYYGTSQLSANRQAFINDLNKNPWVRYGQYGIAEDAIQDAGYIKLREISLGYCIPLRLLQLKSKLNVSLFANNILLFSRYKGVDPETNLTGASNGIGLDYFNIPGSQSIGVALNWEF